LEKENAKTVKVNNMPDGLDPTAIWYMMKHHCQYHQAERTVGRKLERFMTTFVLSPSKEESANFTMEDWSNLQDEALEVLDSVGLTPNGFSNEIKTNFTNSMNVGGLHSDSKSGTLHLHIDCCRVDMEGNTNDVHDIHLRAMKAAEIINMRHGWEQPQEIRNMRKVELAEDCENTLKDMQQFNIDRYFNLLRMKGYEVKPRYDKQRKLVGYTVGKNASVFKALRWSDIKRNEETNTLVIIQKKTKALNAVPIGNTALSWMPPKGNDDFVFHLPAKANMDAALKRIAKKVGIEKNISFHCARHTFGILVQAVTGNIETTKKLMGHKSLKSTAIYADVLTNEKVKAVDNTKKAFRGRKQREENKQIPRTKRTAATNTHPRRITFLQDNK
jgi:hypothetical protein